MKKTGLAKWLFTWWTKRQVRKAFKKALSNNGFIKYLAMDEPQTNPYPDEQPQSTPSGIPSEPSVPSDNNPVDGGTPPVVDEPLATEPEKTAPQIDAPITTNVLEPLINPVTKEPNPKAMDTPEVPKDEPKIEKTKKKVEKTDDKKETDNTVALIIVGGILLLLAGFMFVGYLEKRRKEREQAEKDAQPIDTTYEHVQDDRPEYNR